MEGQQQEHGGPCQEAGGGHGWECFVVIGEGHALRSDATDYSAPPVVGATV
jgi:hypothetical protein